MDVETANPDVTSICQIGLIEYKNGVSIREWSSYIDPKDYFCELNISIHGIQESTVLGSPTFNEVSSKIYDFLIIS